MDKKTLRKQLKIKRNSMPAELIIRHSAKIAALFITRFYRHIPRQGCVMSYLSTRSEVKTSKIISFLLSKGVEMYVPCVKGDDMVPVKYTKGCKLVKGAFEIKEPAKKTALRRPGCIGLILVPGIAFDRDGHRLGFGKGYFDRFLKRLPEKVIKVGLSFENQVIPAIPAEKHDVKMNYIITERGVFTLEHGYIEHIPEDENEAY